MSNYMAKVNFKDLILDELRVSTHGTLETLRATLRSLEDGSYDERALPGKSFVRLSYPTTINSQGKKEGEIRKAFINTIKAFIDFIDKSIATKKLGEESLHIPKSIKKNRVRKIHYLKMGRTNK